MQMDFCAQSPVCNDWKITKFRPKATVTTTDETEGKKLEQIIMTKITQCDHALIIRCVHRNQKIRHSHAMNREIG